LARAVLYQLAWRRTSQLTLRISVYDFEDTMSISLEGRLAGPWVAELSRVWVEAAPQLHSRKLIVDLRNVTYADSAGINALKEIYSQTQAKLLSASPWTEYLVREVSKTAPEKGNEEVANANRA
jgi:anti-anti-sigma factor